MENFIFLKVFLLWIGFIILYQGWVKPALEKAFFEKRKRELIKVFGGSLPDFEFNPAVSNDELELLKSNECPTDEHILKYYKMYLAKDRLEKEDTWSTKQPISFDEWEKIAKRPTEIMDATDDIGFQINGGYQYIIPMTCDSMIGMPPNQYYHRYYDYVDMAKVDNKSMVDVHPCKEGEIK